MDKFTKRLQAEMTLMEGKELRFGSNIPGTDKMDLCKKAIESIQRYMENMERNPEDYAEEDNTQFQMRVELCKLNDSYFNYLQEN